MEISCFSKHGTDKIKISILKIVSNKTERLICENEIMVKFGTDCDIELYFYISFLYYLFYIEIQNKFAAIGNLFL